MQKKIMARNVTEATNADISTKIANESTSFKKTITRINEFRGLPHDHSQ